jgi:hypothetical protein
MRFSFLMVPAALLATMPAQADEYLTVPQAQAVLFPGASFTPADVNLTADQVDKLIKVSQSIVLRSKIKAWKVSTGGWFILDQVPGRDDIVTYAVGLDDKGAVTGIEILVCAGDYSSVRDRKWLGLFKGKNFETADELLTAIPNMSGASLSATHIMSGVKRVVTSYALFLAHKPT